MTMEIKLHISSFDRMPCGCAISSWKHWLRYTRLRLWGRRAAWHVSRRADVLRERCAAARCRMERQFLVPFIVGCGLVSLGWGLEVLRRIKEDETTLRMRKELRGILDGEAVNMTKDEYDHWFGGNSGGMEHGN